MKKSLLIALFAIATTTSYATVLTVSNSPFGGAQYSTLLAAYNAATNGDTLHVEGTNVTYFLGQNGGWAKSLTVIGIGFNPDKQNPGKTVISSAHSGSQSAIFSVIAGGSGSSFYGINFTSVVATYGGATNLLFANCDFNSFIGLNQSSSAITIRNCIFKSLNGQNMYLDGSVISGVLVSNCVFSGYIVGSSNVNVSMNVDHCLFLGSGGAIAYALWNATISNCIFMNSFPLANQFYNCNFLNNISRLAGTFPPAGLGNTASNNIEATDPNLVTYTLGAAYSTAHDYNLQAGSAAIAAGSDGTDIGVHGGTNMFFSESGEVLINPIIREVSILTPTVTPNGTLNVKVIATKPKDN